MTENNLFFQGWEGLLRTSVVSILAYMALIILLRISGKRTLSKMNAFDLVVTVALGSTLATVLLSKDVALAEGVLAFSLLILMQFMITWVSVRVKLVRNLVKGEPTLLFYQGDFLDSQMVRQRVTQDEVMAAIRAEGILSPNAVEAVVLETDGSFTVVSGKPATSSTSLQTVQNYPPKTTDV